MITLDPTTWEEAAKMKNFSGWVRSKLREKMEAAVIAKDNAPEYGAYCEACDVTAINKNKWFVEHKYCPKCHTAMKFLGVVEE